MIRLRLVVGTVHVSKLTVSLTSMAVAQAAGFSGQERQNRADGYPQKFFRTHVCTLLNVESTQRVTVKSHILQSSFFIVFEQSLYLHPLCIKTWMK